MNKVVTIGKVPWSRKDLTGKLEEFAELYKERPIRNNKHGMKSPHMFLAWFALQWLKPRAIVESGVWRGQGTWLFEKACPHAQLYCIDIDTDQIQYKSSNATYFNQDFSTINWNHLPKNDTLLFFDDHQNAYERLKTAQNFGFRQMIFEDNYPPSQDSCCSLKTLFMCSNSGYIKSIIIRKIINLLGIMSGQKMNINWSAFYKNRYLMQNIETYYEFPPVIKTEMTRWNDQWINENYPTPPPLLDSVEKNYQQIYLDEAIYYTWMCYVKLK